MATLVIQGDSFNLNDLKDIPFVYSEKNGNNIDVYICIPVGRGESVDKLYISKLLGYLQGGNLVTNDKKPLNWYNVYLKEAGELDQNGAANIPVTSFVINNPDFPFDYKVTVDYDDPQQGGTTAIRVDGN